MLNHFDLIVELHSSNNKFASLVNFNLSSSLKPMEVVELFGALFHCGYITGKKDDLWEWVSNCLNIKLSQPNSNMTKVKNRTNESTIFISKLTNKFNEFCINDLEK